MNTDRPIYVRAIPYVMTDADRERRRVESLSPIHPDRADNAAGWDGMRATVAGEVDTLAAWSDLGTRDHGDVSAERAYHAGLKADQDAPRDAAQRPIDDYAATAHTIRRGRNRKGATARVVAVGVLPKLTGDAEGLPYVPTAAWCADKGRDDLVTLDALTLARMADEWYAMHAPIPDGWDDLDDEQRYDATHLPSLVGTVQGRSWEQLTDAGDDPGAVAVLAQHRTDIGGGYVRVPRWLAFDREGRDDGAPVRRLKRREISRSRIAPPSVRRDDYDAETVQDGKRTVTRRRTILAAGGDRFGKWSSQNVDANGTLVTYGDSGPWTVRTVKVKRTVHYWDGTTEELTDEVRRGNYLPADRVHVGGTTVARPGKRARTRGQSTARRESAAAAAVRRQHVAAVTSSTDAAALIAAADAATDGQSVAVTLPGGTLVTFTAAPGKAVRYRWTRGGDGGTFRVRTAQAAAMRLATLGA
jgi:hypothetical protein